jgi:hypothetical protein
MRCRMLAAVGQTLSTHRYLTYIIPSYFLGVARASKLHVQVEYMQCIIKTGA